MKNITLTVRQLGVAAAFLLFVAAGQQAHAQAPGSTGPTPGAVDPTSVPLDGGASLLLAGGVAYGLRRLRQRRRK